MVEKTPTRADLLQRAREEFTASAGMTIAQMQDGINHQYERIVKVTLGEDYPAWIEDGPTPEQLERRERKRREFQYNRWGHTYQKGGNND